VQQRADRIRHRAAHARGLAVEAITAAHRTGLVAGNAIMHTDRGSQYHSTAHRNALQRLEIRQSTSRTGSCLDGAAAESFFATIKAEIGAASWPDRASARRDIETWITHYNQRRLHSALDYQTPTSARNAWQERMSIGSIGQRGVKNRADSTAPPGASEQRESAVATLRPGHPAQIGPKIPSLSELNNSSPRYMTEPSWGRNPLPPCTTRKASWTPIPPGRANAWIIVGAENLCDVPVFVK
jgi:hypothetical protein